MRHRKAHRKLGRTTSHRKALFRNMLTALVNNDRIETTLAKAKELKPLADKMVSLGKDGSLAARRRAISILQDKSSVKKLFSTLADRFGDRKGGYTRVLKLGFRHGDNSPMAIIEFLTAEIKKKAEKKTEKKAEKQPTKKKTAKKK